MGNTGISALKNAARTVIRPRRRLRRSRRPTCSSSCLRRRNRRWPQPIPPAANGKSRKRLGLGRADCCRCRIDRRCGKASQSPERESLWSIAQTASYARITGETRARHRPTRRQYFTANTTEVYRVGASGWLACHSPRSFNKRSRPRGKDRTQTAKAWGLLLWSACTW